MVNLLSSSSIIFVQKILVMDWIKDGFLFSHRRSLMVFCVRSVELNFIICVTYVLTNNRFLLDISLLFQIFAKFYQAKLNKTSRCGTRYCIQNVDGPVKTGPDQWCITRIKGNQVSPDASRKTQNMLNSDVKGFDSFQLCNSFPHGWKNTCSLMAGGKLWSKDFQFCSMYPNR